MHDFWNDSLGEARRGTVRGERLAAGWVAHAAVAGFLASAIMLLGFVIAYGLAALLASIPLSHNAIAGVVQGWLYALTHNAVTDLGRDHLYLAVAVYLVGGLLWAIVYARFAATRLAGPHWRRGLVFSLVPAATSLVVVLPLLGGGLFAFQLGAGPLPLIGNLLLHALYGLALGVLYGPTGYLSAEDWSPTTAEERQMLAGAERVAVGGALVGGLLGIAAGLLVLLVGLRGMALPDLPAAAVLLLTVAGGTALGALAGSLIGPADSDEPAG
jgi:hypothetical protein